MNLYQNSLSLEERVRGLIAWIFVVDESGLKDDTHFVKDLGADSMDLIEMVISVNEAFSIELDTTHLEDMLTLRNLTAIVRTKLDAITV